MISVDTKKKALIAEFKNPGRAWRPKGQPVQVHDFPSSATGKAIPYGVYDLGHNHGFVNLGTSHDTPDFAVESIRLWWETEGQSLCPKAAEWLVLADAGGSNSAQRRVWKVRQQALAGHLGRPITVCHLPPGSSKWNKIEHRLFSYISIHSRCQPLVDYQTVVSLIGTTTTKTGPTVTAGLDLDEYPAGVRVSDAELASLALQPYATHPQWNDTPSPRSRRHA